MCANFLQSRPIQYKDYVNVNPIEAETYVGMQREGELQQGIQKVNSYFESIAGLDIYRDSDKEYLNNKIADLKTGIGNTLSGDFSDQRITNQIGGGAAAIAKDKRVQTAVSSTATIRKGYADIEAARKDGKSNPNNEAYYDNDVSKYANSSDPDASFNSPFYRHTDILKMVTDVTSKAGIDESVVDYIYNKKGLPSDVMTTEEIKNNLPKIQAAIDLVTKDGNVQKQLQIDGWNAYKGVEVSALYNPMVESYNNRQTELQQRHLDLGVLLSATNLTDEEKNQYEAERAQIIKQGIANESNFTNLEKIITENPDAFKEQLYITEYKQNLVETFSSQTHKTKYSDNPAMKQFMDVLKFNFDKEKERTSNYYKADAKKLGWANFYADNELDPTTGQYKKKDTTKTKYKPNDPTNTPNPSGGNSTDVDKRIEKFNQDVANLETENNAAALDVYADYLALSNNGVTKKGEPITKEIALREANIFAAQTGEKVEDYIMRFAINARKRLEDAQLKAPAQVQAKIDNLTKKQELYAGFKLAELSATKTAEKVTGYDIETLKNDINLNQRGNAPLMSSGKGALSLVDPFWAASFFTAKTEEEKTRIANSPQTYNLYQATKNKELSRIIPYYNNLSTQGVDLEQSKAKVLEFVNTTPSLAGVPEEDRAGIVEALTKSESGLTFSLQQPLFVGQPWSAGAVVSYKGKEYTIPNVPTNSTGKTLQPYELDPDEILIETTGTNSTSRVNPNIASAHESAWYGASKFTGLDPKSPYVVKANIAKVENPNGGPKGSQLVFYVKEKGGEFKNVQGPVIYPGPKVENPTASLKQYISRMTDGDVKFYLNQNK